MAAPTITTAQSEPGAGRAALEVLLTDAAGDSARLVRPVATAKFAAGLARHPQKAVRRAGALGAELTRVAAGRSTVRPAKRDRRFADPAWQSNPFIRRVLQTYLAAGAAVDGLIDDAEVGWRVERNVRFAAARPGALTALGTPVDLSAVTVDSYIVAGLTDHIIPWENAYRSTQLLGGDTRFVLSTSGHVQAMVNPPGRAGAESRATYRIAGEHPAEPEAWLERAASRPGSRWTDYAAWLGERSGGEAAAPAKPGSRTHKPTAKAPGSYVHAN